ncbi:hypothetical protein IRT45_23035 [Nocardia sp. BSTN01]|uniref:hypothetical protein n=1 Tax=Nocardia sp. BSTN01 TaxID=2783665 RepID=UPI00188FEAF9|nr:hypothetical protein [Nocardia sp. BSTN01]MBF5000023.1 hypothetical protein [Nocardia sp. BSTN01]
MQPGFIATEMSARADDARLVVPLERGVAAMVAAIEAEPVRACVPQWPWRALNLVWPRLPRAVVARLGRPGSGSPALGEVSHNRWPRPI